MAAIAIERILVAWKECVLLLLVVIKEGENESARYCKEWTVEKFQRWMGRPFRGTSWPTERRRRRKEYQVLFERNVGSAKTQLTRSGCRQGVGRGRMGFLLMINRRSRGMRPNEIRSDVVWTLRRTNQGGRQHSMVPCARMRRKNLKPTIGGSCAWLSLKGVIYSRMK
jgi:hypothetical protein